MCVLRVRGQKEQSNFIDHVGYSSFPLLLVFQLVQIPLRGKIRCQIFRKGLNDTQSEDENLCIYCLSDCDNDSETTGIDDTKTVEVISYKASRTKIY